MVIYLAFQIALDDHLGQRPLAGHLAGQHYPSGAGLLGKLAQQLLIRR